MSLLQSERSQERNQQQQQWIDAMSDLELKRTALTMVFIQLGERALAVLGYQVPR